MKTVALMLLFAFVPLFSSAKGEKMNFHDFEYKTLEGKTQPFSEYKGKLVLVVNTASQCGYTPQYEGLQELYDKYKGKGFTVLAFPCNDFGAQEPGSASDIRGFVDKNFQITFPVFEKVRVKGDNKADIYEFFAKSFPEEVKWNFTKFLISPEGRILERFESAVTPSDPSLISKIESNLPK